MVDTSKLYTIGAARRKYMMLMEDCLIENNGKGCTRREIIDYIEERVNSVGAQCKSRGDRWFYALREDMNAIYSKSNEVLFEKGRYKLRNESNLIQRFEYTTKSESKSFFAILEMVSELDGIPLGAAIKGNCSSAKISIPKSTDLNINGFNLLYDALIEEQVVKISYNKSFGSAQDVYVSPHMLKRFNNKWVLIGHQSGSPYEWTIYSLDRIKCIMKSDKAKRFSRRETDYDEYYKDVIGYYIPVNSRGKKPDSIEIKFEVKSEKLFNIINANPIHSSMIITDKENMILSVKVIENPLLYNRLLQYGAGIEVLEPAHIRDKIKNIVGEMVNIYEDR